MSLIELSNVSKLYGFGDATTLALDEVSLSIEENEFVAIMGPSGCGKSTLMNLMGLLDRPTHGDYLLRGRYVSKLRASQRAKIRRDTVGFVFQSFNLLPRMTVLENVALPLVYKGVPVNKRIKQASAMLERVGLRNREYFYPRHLSGGQAQCAAIARALVNDPSVIIADEPTGNLDSANSRLVMELLSDIHKTGGTILFVTHNPELTRYATRVVYMHDGAVIHDEQTVIGEVAATARRIMFTVPTKTEEDDLAGVSTLMKHVPDATLAVDASPAKTPVKKKAKSRTKAKKSRSAKK
jgi:putative ABC transport system ATP-binding protein